MAVPSERALKPGDVLAGKYVLGKCIGAGGMGLVFLAEDPALARCVAVKVLHPHLASHAMFMRRFRDEAVAASRVRHRRSVTVIDFQVGTDGTPFIAMELVPGRPLGQIIREEVIPLRRALGIFGQILDALGAAHARSVVHADVKSDNFMVDPQDGGDVVTMIDFGLAHLDGAPTEPGFIAGTPEYIAPELVRGGPPTIASDLYGAGTILYELLTGATPFASGSGSEIMRRQLRDAVIPPSLRRPDREIPDVLDRVVLRALDKDPRARFANAQEIRNALEAISLGRDVPTHRPWLAETSRSSPDSPTPICIIPPMQRPIARGSDTGSTGQPELRRAIAGALEHGDISGIASGYAALAAALAREQQLGAAICELEEGIDVVTAGQGPVGADVPESVDPLVASLAALYERTGEPQQARRVLASADGHATLVEPTDSRTP